MLGREFVEGQQFRAVFDQFGDGLDAVDCLLAEAGSDKAHMLQAIIWMADMADFAEMNAVWDVWVPEGTAPVRTCGEARLATPEYLVEVIITAGKI